MTSKPILLLMLSGALVDCGREHDAVGGRRSRCPARRRRRWLPCQHFHGIAGSPADDSEHVPASRWADAVRIPCVGSHHLETCPLDLQRPLGRDGLPPDRLCVDVVGLRSGSHGSRTLFASVVAEVKNPVLAFFRWLPYLRRDVEDWCKSFSDKVATVLLQFLSRL